MMTRKRAWHALSYCIAAALLAGCGGSQPPTGTPGAMPQLPAVSPNSIMAHSGATSSSYQIVYRFAGGTDGQKPQASLIDVNGTLYGTTTTGGAYCQESDGAGCGTAFSVATTGTENVLHSFGNGTDGTAPTSSLIGVNGTLYGTTAFGGGYCAADGATGCGTVFSITPTGTEQGLHRFGSGLSETNTVEYRNPDDALDALRARVREVGIRAVSRQTGLSRRHVQEFVNERTAPQAETAAKLEGSLQKLTTPSAWPIKRRGRHAFQDSPGKF
jgi:hypothetical protein